MSKVIVYKDRGAGTWSWSCQVPFCGRQEWVVGGHRTALTVACQHLGGHYRTGFRRQGLTSLAMISQNPAE